MRLFGENEMCRKWIPTVIAAVVATCLLWVLPLAAHGQEEKGAAPSASGALGTPPPAVVTPAGQSAKNIAVIVVDDEITRTTAFSVKRRLDEAQRDGADLIVLSIDTPGGEVGAVLDICTALKRSPIPTVAWVRNHALSGGALLALACNRIICADPVSVGDAKPIAMALGTAGSIPKDMLMKILPPLIGEVVDSAQRRNRAEKRYVYDELLVQGIIVSDAALWQVEDVKTGARYCVTEAEVRELFPEASLEGAPMLAGAGSVARQGGNGQGSKGGNGNGSAEQGSSEKSPNATVADASLTAASPTAQEASEQAVNSLSGPSLRPVFGSAERGKYRLVGKVSAGTGPLVFNAGQMAQFGFADNVSSDGTLMPVTTDQQLQQYFNAQSVREYRESAGEQIFGNAAVFLSSPIVRGLLIVAFLVCMFIEFTHPGAVVPATLGLIFLALLVAPPLLMGLAAWWTVAMILIGIGLILVEVLFLPGLAVPGVIGFVMLFVGLVGTIAGVGSPFPGVSGGMGNSRDISIALVTVVLSIGTAFLAMFFLGRNLYKLPVFRRAVLTGNVALPEPDQVNEEIAPLRLGENDEPLRPGTPGVCISPLRPTGSVQFGEVVREASGDLGFIDSGAPVEIVSIKGDRIIVRATGPGPARASIAEDTL
jgi:membrane-bound ClpP family serine protease